MDNNQPYPQPAQSPQNQQAYPQPPHNQQPYINPAAAPAPEAPATKKPTGLIIGAVAFFLLATIVTVAVFMIGGQGKSYDELKVKLASLSKDNGISYCYDSEDTILAEELKDELGEDMDKVEGIYICSNLDLTSAEKMLETGLTEDPQIVMGVYGKKGQHVDSRDMVDNLSSDSGSWVVGKDRWIVVGMTEGTQVKDGLIKDFKGKDLATR